MPDYNPAQDAVDTAAAASIANYSLLGIDSAQTGDNQLARFSASSLKTVFQDGVLPATQVLTIAALRSFTGAANNQLFFVRNYAVTGDGGGGFFYADTSDTTSTDNNGTVIVGTSGTRFKRIFDKSKPRDVRWFGARCDTTTDDTAAINNCLATLPSGGGAILIPDGVMSGNLTFSISNWIQLFVEGTWRLKESLVLDRKIHIIGTTSFNAGHTQFQLESAAGITTHSSYAGNALIKVVGTGGVTIESVNIFCNGTCLYLGHPNPTDPAATGSVANMYIRKCGIQSYSGNPSIIVDSVFWVQITDCAINNTVNTPQDSAIEFRHSLLQGSYTGLIRIKNCTTTGGVRFTNPTGNPIASYVNIVFDDVLYEIAVNPFLVIDDGVDLATVTIISSEWADPVVDSLPVIRIGANCNIGSWYIRDSFNCLPSNPFFDAQSPIRGLVIDTFNSIAFYGNGYDTGYDDPNYPSLCSATGVLTGPVESVYRVGLHSLPVDAVVFPTNPDPTSWTGLNTTITTFKGLDGTNTAGLLTPGTGTIEATFLSTPTLANSAVTANDYLILGGWLNNIDYSGFGITFSALGNNVVLQQNVATTATNTYWAWNTNFDQRYVERGNYWIPFGFVIKVVSVNSGGINFVAKMNNMTSPKAIWQPFLIRLPASGNYTRKEVSKLLASQFRNIHPDNLPGYIGISATQKFDAGSEILLSGITGKPRILGGSTNPEGSVTAPPGSLYTMTNGTSASLYFKASGTGNTGWTLK